MKILPGISYQGKISKFGGPFDIHVSHNEGLALCERVEEFPHLFMQEKPMLLKDDPGYPGFASGLARRLDITQNYVACRWDYTVTPKPVIRLSKVVLSNGLRKVEAQPIDWGPNENTGRIVDASDAVLEALKVKTDDDVKIFLIIPKTV